MPLATVIIATRNRKLELRRCLRSTLEQTPPVDVLLLDDGSTDGTDSMVRAEFPSVRLERFETSAGLIVRRNQAALLAHTPFLVSLDDDAAFSDSHIVAKSLSEFNHPRIGAVAIPFVNVLQSAQIHQRTPEKNGDILVTDTYIGTAHSLRRDVFLALDGYRAHFVHQGEESDYCLRMLAAGYTVRLGGAEPILHYESPNRDLRRMDYYGRRNDVLFAWHNVPMPEIFLHLAVTIINGFRTACTRADYPLSMLRGTITGCLDCWRLWRERRPVPRSIYRLHRRLKKEGARPLADIETYLPPIPARINPPPASVPAVP